MQNKVQLLPDSVANQIAAGEVVQRPASVVKELVENAIDAGAKSVTLIIKDAGRTLIQVVDNGAGMSEVDARLAFERHATSKVRSAQDLFALQTFGFRGEALPSIAAVAEVELKTRTADEEIGTRIVINGGTLDKQERISNPIGTSIAVRNLFYNVPARRKFLKADTTEARHIEQEFKRVALCYPHVALVLQRDGRKEYDLPASNLKQRIISIFGSTRWTKGLLEVGIETEVVQLNGFIITPESAVKEQDKQYFFVNGRYFHSTYFRSAVQRAYEQLLPSGYYPSFFLYMQVPLDKLDVNIHPTKTEVKFEDDKIIWQIVNAAVREAVGKYALAPRIDFDMPPEVRMSIPTSRDNITAPQIAVNHSYNPFNTDKQPTSVRSNSSQRDWQKMYNSLTSENKHPFFSGEDTTLNDDDSIIVASKINIQQEQQLSLSEMNDSQKRCMQLKGKYILCIAQSGLMVIDQVRAHQRILYEDFLQHSDHAMPSQQLLFPHSMDLQPADHSLLLSVQDDLQQMGLEINDFGMHSIVVQAMPATAHEQNPEKLIEKLITLLKLEERSLQDNHKHIVSASMAKSLAKNTGTTLVEEEMQSLVTRLLACKSPDICPYGKPTINIMNIEEFDKRFLKH
ncbi:MAG: DNA mismatch repair endonuclease MutL [Bacteroidales bacterium]